MFDDSLKKDLKAYNMVLPFVGLIHLQLGHTTSLSLIRKAIINMAMVLRETQVIITSAKKIDEITSNFISEICDVHNIKTHMVSSEVEGLLSDIASINLARAQKISFDIFINLYSFDLTSKDAGLMKDSLISIAASPLIAYLNLRKFSNKKMGIICHNFVTQSLINLDQEARDYITIHTECEGNQTFKSPMVPFFMMSSKIFDYILDFSQLFRLVDLIGEGFWGLLASKLEYSVPVTISNKSVKTVGIHFPQFHAIPENDKFWGPGFTEWTYLRQCIGRKRANLGIYDHEIRQPHPDIGYYDLTIYGDRKKQGDLAKKYEVDLFMYYHYWFDCGRVMHRVPEYAAALEEPNIPFFLCWANEPWNRRWSGLEEEILLGQTYGNEQTWTKHYEYLDTLFRSPNYYKIAGRPVFAVYRVDHMGDEVFKRMMNTWNQLATPTYGGLYIIPRQNKQLSLTGNMNAFYEFEPHHSWNLITRTNTRKSFNLKGYQDNKTLIRFGHKVSDVIADQPRTESSYLGAYTHWDDTPRHQNNPRLLIFTEPTKQTFKTLLLIQLVKSLLTIGPSDKFQEDLVFISSWNEWNEGAVMEPSVQDNYMFLEAHKECKTFITRTIH